MPLPQIFESLSVLTGHSPPKNNISTIFSTVSISILHTYALMMYIYTGAVDSLHRIVDFQVLVDENIASQCDS
jgi:hypothetical protein